MRSRNHSRINHLRMCTIYQALKLAPGLTAGRLALALGWKPDTIHNALPTMEALGLFVSEDPDGCLYPFAISEPQPISNPAPTMVVHHSSSEV